MTDPVDGKADPPAFVRRCPDPRAQLHLDLPGARRVATDSVQQINDTIEEALRPARSP